MGKFLIKVKNVIFKVFKYILYTLIVVAIIYYVADEMFISKQEIDDMKYSKQEFPDGEYLAEVKYKNTCTGFKSFYELVVNLRGDSLKRLNFENGGYLNENHIFPQKMQKDKYIDVKDIDNCKVYSVKILHQE